MMKLTGEDVEYMVEQLMHKKRESGVYDAWYEAITSNDTLLGYLQNLEIKDNMDDADVLRQIKDDVKHLKPKQMVLKC